MCKPKGLQYTAFYSSVTLLCGKQLSDCFKNLLNQTLRYNMRQSKKQGEKKQQKTLYIKCETSAFTHITQLLIDFAGMYVNLHVRQADPLVQVFTIVHFTDHFLGVAGSHYF